MNRLLGRARLDSNLSAPPRPALAPMAVLLAWFFVVASCLAPSETLFFRDHALVFHRLLFLVKQAYQSGTLPLWDPFVGGGEPLAAYPAAMALSPFALIHLLPFDGLVTYDLFVASLLLLAGLSGERLARALQLSVPSRALVGIVFMLAGPVSSLSSLLPALQSVAVMPLVLATGLGLSRRPDARSAAGFGLAVAWHVSISDPSVVFSTIVLGGLLLGSDFLRSGGWAGENRPLRRRGLAFLFAVVVAMTVSAAAWIPVLHLLAGTARGGGFSYAVASRYSLAPLRIFEALLPGLGSDPLQLDELFSTHGGSAYLPSIYLGAIALFLAALGVLRRGAEPWIIGGAILLLLALGENTPVHRAVVTAVPGLSLSRFPVKFLGGAALAFAIVAGFGLERLMERMRDGGRQLGLTLPAAAAVLLPFLASLALTDTFIATRSQGSTLERSLQRIHGAEAHASLFLVLLAVVLGVVALGGRALVPWMLVVFASTDLALAARDGLPTIDVEAVRSSPLRRALLADSPRPLLFQYDEFFDAGLPLMHDRRDFTRFVVRRVGPHFSGRDGVHYLLDQDLNGTRPVSWHKAFARLAEVDESKRMNLLRRTGHTHVVVEANVPETPDLTLVARDEILPGLPTSLFRIKGARPLPAVLTEGIPVSDQASVLERLFTETSSTGLVSDRESLAALGLLGPPGRAEQKSDAQLARARARVEILSEDARSMRLRVTSAEHGALVLPISFDPDWGARVNGGATKVVRAEYFWSGVPVDAGVSDVELTYAPRSTKLGMVISAVGLGLAALAWFLGRRGRGGHSFGAKLSGPIVGLSG